MSVRAWMAATTRNAVRMRVNTGCVAASQASPIAIASSVTLRTPFEMGSGLVLTAARAEALVPCEVKATPPAIRAATTRQGGVRKLIAALETHGITSLARPIKAWDGYDGANGFVIG